MVVTGETELVPPATGVTAPTLLFMVNVVAFVVVQVRTDEPPTVTEVGPATRVQVGAAGGGMGYVHVTPA